MKKIFSLILVLGAVALFAPAVARAFVTGTMPVGSFTSSTPSVIERYKPARRTVKGIYLTAATAANPKRLKELIKLIDTTELNAMVIDIKDYTGAVLYDSNVPLVNKLKTERVVIKDVPGLINSLHERGIYAIARQTVFQDPLLARRKNAWAIRRADGLWHDNNGLPWVDPTRQEVWEYNAAIAEEAVELGFDEINLDYIRFPSDGPLATARYHALVGKKHQTMAEFYAFITDRLGGRPAWVSADMFGLVMEANKNYDLGIGQRLADAIDKFDYICPMMYPSHYAAGHLGFRNPASAPGAVIEHGMKKGSLYFSNDRTQVRPWLQAFNMGAVYDAKKIRAQIDAVERHTDAGWLLWNAANRYTAAGLKPGTDRAASSTKPTGL